MSNKYCPRCSNSLLTPMAYEGEELDVCRKCGGMWFEKNELNSLLSAFDNGDDAVQFEEQLGKRLGQTDADCPQCNAKLYNYHLLESFQVEVDICHKCDGTWIDHDELEEVKHSPRLRDVLNNINQKTSWKTWLFQFLSQMPVEYNVKPHRTPVVTWALIIINCLIYFTYATSDEMTNQVFELFASTPSDFAHGEHLWTPLTATFLHGSLMHLLGNMYFLWLTGDNLEDALGRWRFLGLYLICGLGASAFSIGMNWNSTIPSVGASGAIAGLFGMYMIWFRHASLTFMIVVWQKKLSAAWYFLIWLGINLFGMAVGGGGIDYWAHIGGFIIGVVIALLLKNFVMERNPVIAMLAKPHAQLLR
ncbi:MULTISPECIES: rhomboid family intramembrane serine protease [unclassified Thalassolituus]|uniref:rhomboid family intramembrane serine protease n=1 Tax=Oceanospirillaceae TaxID=135620 RepID=UPI000C58273F|nr:rhomboid family intramembrane serine protease [Thalassolituus sp. C2-1]PIQ40388.1 MAG: rhomboid family intramembrane serine protease [Thalassolituus sp. CG17_big_fil_post_rev_8_21_14_2_50_53_8]